MLLKGTAIATCSDRLNGAKATSSPPICTLNAKVDAGGWTNLSPEEQDCYQAFLLDLKDGDYVVYINVPDYGKCSLARVTGPYFWRYDGEDFNHRFPRWTSHP